MEILWWILFGGLAGWLASILMGTDLYQGTLTDIALGILGALVGGLVMNLFGFVGVTGFNLYSFFVAVLGAVMLIAIGRAMRRG